MLSNGYRVVMNSMSSKPIEKWWHIIANVNGNGCINNLSTASMQTINTVYNEQPRSQHELASM